MSFDFIISVCLPMSLKPSHSIQELPTFVCCELFDIKLGFPLPYVCVKSIVFLKKSSKWVCPTSPKCVSPNEFKTFTQHSRVTGFCML